MFGLMVNLVKVQCGTVILTKNTLEDFNKITVLP